MKKRIFCLALALLMLVGMLPVSAFAEGKSEYEKNETGTAVFNPECNSGTGDEITYGVAYITDNPADGLNMNVDHTISLNGLMAQTFVIDDSYVGESGYWYKLAALEGEELPGNLSTMPWVYQNDIPNQGYPDYLLITPPANTCRCCENCTGAEGCECGCEECDYCEPVTTDPTTPTDPSQPECGCCDACADAEGCTCGCENCQFCEPSTPENPCKCCENCTGAEDCECGCENCQFCEPSTPENPCKCCENCTGAEDCQCGCENCQFCEPEEPEYPTLTDPATGAKVYVETLPEGVTLNVDTNVDGSALLSDFQIPGAQLVFAWDISLRNADNTEYQPGSGAMVKIPVNAAAGTKIGLLHKHSGGTSFMGVTEVLTDGTIEFYTDSFSEFAGFTVDFHYNGVDFSIPGLSEILLSKLFEIMEINENAFAATSVVFSDNSLIGVQQQADGDWLLTSLEAFQTEETLIITFTGGRSIVIDVTDATDTGYEDGIWHVNYGDDGMNFHFACAAGGGLYTVRLDIYDNGTRVYSESEGTVITGATFWANGGGNDYWYEYRDSYRMGNVDYTALDGGNKRVIGTGIYNIFYYTSQWISFNRYSREIFGSSNPYATIWQACELVMDGDTVNRNVVIYVDGREVDRKNNVLFPNRDDSSTALAEDLDVITPRAGYHKRGDVGGGATVVVSGNTYNVYLVTSGTIAYNANGGSGAPESQTKYYGVNLTLQSGQPTKAYSTFKGWATTEARADAGTVDYNPGATYTSNLTPGSTVTLYAVWDYAAANYTVKHLQQNVAGTGYDEVTADRQTIASKAYASVTPAVKSYTGFKSPSTQTVTVNGNGSTVVEYKYDRLSYTVTANAGTGISAVSGGGTYKYGASVTIGATVSDGYSWENWTGYNTQTAQSYTFTMPASNVTYTANATRSSYSISYELNGGTVTPENPKSYTADTATFTLTNPTKEGYTFDGWTGTGLTEKTKTVTIPKGSTGDRSYTANWTGNDYYLTFDFNGGNNGQQPSGPYDAQMGTGRFCEVTWLKPAREGYDFAGWYDAKTGGTQVYYGATDQAQDAKKTSGWYIPGTKYWNTNQQWIYAANLDLYAHWTPKTDATYTVHYYKEGTTENVQDDKVVNGATFDKVYSETAPETIDNYIIVGDKTKTVTAGYTGNEVTFYYKLNAFSVSYAYTGEVPSGAAAAPTATTETVGSDVTVANAPTLTGYTFSGWSADGITITNGKFTMPNKAVTFTGSWTLIDYTIYYELDDGKNNPLNPTSYNVESEAITLVNPSKTGYNFTGWTGTGLTQATQPVTIPKGSTGNRIYTANWTPKTYTITYNHNDKDTNPTTSTVSYDIEDEFTLNDAPTREGYKFSKWNLAAGLTAPNGNWAAGDYDASQQIAKGMYGDIELVAQWTDQYRYVLKFDANTTDQVSNMPEDADTTWIDAATHTFTWSEDPTRENYDFLGWATSADATEAQFQNSYKVTTGKPHDTEEVTLYAVWKRQTGNLVLDYVGDGAPAIVNVSGEGLNINLVISADKTIVNLPTGDYTVTAQSGNASYSASVDPSGTNNADVTADTANPATVKVTVASRGLNWFTGFHWKTNRCS